MDYIAFKLLTDSDRLLPLYLTSVGRWRNQEPVDRPGGFPSYQWLLCLSGEGELHVNGEACPVKAGQAICLFPDVTHRYYALEEPWGMLFISMEGNLCAPLLERAGIGRSGVYNMMEPESTAGNLQPILEAARNRATFTTVEGSKLLYAFLLHLAEQVSAVGNTIHQSIRRLEPVFAYIRKECHRTLTIDELAAQAEVTPQYLCSLFRKTMNLRPMEYVNRERINRSKELIYLKPGAKLKDIARLAGFEHPSYFSTVFKRLEGRTPEEFKQSHGITAVPLKQNLPGSG